MNLNYQKRRHYYNAIQIVFAISNLIIMACNNRGGLIKFNGMKI